jgi:hypothetical protein
MRSLLSVSVQDDNASADYGGDAATFVAPWLYQASPNTGTVAIETNTTMSADIGGSIVLGGRYVTGNPGGAHWAKIAGLKDNGTSGDYGGYLALYSRPNGGSITERMRITSGGNVLVGTTTDNGSLLQVQGGTNNTATFLSGNVTSPYGTVMVGYNRGYPGMMYLNSDCNAGGGYIAWNASTITNLENGNYVVNGYATKIYGGISGQIRTYTAGSGTAGNAISYTAGPYVANGGVSWTNGSSDERLKKNFETTQGLAEILQINPVKYHFKTDEDTAVKRLGFTAQNLQPLIPEMVLEKDDLAEDGSHYLTITPDYLLPVLVKAIQELKATNDDLQAQINELKAR